MFRAEKTEYTRVLRTARLFRHRASRRKRAAPNRHQSAQPEIPARVLPSNPGQQALANHVARLPANKADARDERPKNAGAEHCRRQTNDKFLRRHKHDPARATAARRAPHHYFDAN